LWLYSERTDCSFQIRPLVSQSIERAVPSITHRVPDGTQLTVYHIVVFRKDTVEDEPALHRRPGRKSHRACIGLHRPSKPAFDGRFWAHPSLHRSASPDGHTAVDRNPTTRPLQSLRIYMCPAYKVPCFITERNSIAPVRGPPHLMALEVMIHS